MSIRLVWGMANGAATLTKTLRSIRLEAFRAWIPNLSWQPHYELAGIGGGVPEGEEQETPGSRVQEVFNGIMLMGVPKSKVSPSRKRMKHLQHVPEPVNWYKCDRCGEPKRPHRICTANLDICALSEDEYKAKVGKSTAGGAEAPPLPK